MKKLFTLLLLVTTVTTISAQCGGIFFSEYIEGSSSNKATEIYNNTGATVNLTDLVVYRFNNGSLTATDSLFPQGVLAAGDVFVFCNPSAIPAIQAQSDTTHTMTFYNGDDAILLKNLVTGDSLDMIGEIGVDPGSGWAVGTGATNNFTLKRMFSITEGEMNWTIGATQWDVFPIDMVDSLGFHYAASGTTVAGFTHGVTGMNASFTNTSTGGGLSYFWDFGDGFSDTTANPAHTYGANGTYLVCLSATGPCGTDVFCDTVTICGPPSAAFTSSSSGMTATFTDASTGPTSWLWDFGDGNTSTMQNPMHTYTANGTYTVCVTAMNSCGADSSCAAVVISCTGPTSGFTSSSADLTSTFTNSSAGATSYLWDFGDGNSDTSANPIHVYGAAGTYVVCLNAINACGNQFFCDTIVITCAVPASSFTSSTSGMTATFTDGSTGPTSWFWDFGDGNTSTTQNPMHTYAANGTYVVCLTATNACGSDSTCTATVISCAGPTAAYSDSVLGMDVAFTNASTGATSYTWDYGDGNTDTTANPTYTYGAAGTYVVCLTATNACGSDIVCDTITVTCPLPVASFTSTDSLLTVDFTDGSTGATSWAWDFGDGNTSTLMDPSHTYASVGTYTVCLTAANSCGIDSTCSTVIVLTTGVEELLSNTSVYPNPFNEQVTVNFGSNLTDVSYTVIDINGKIVTTGNVQNANRMDLNLDVNSGVYFLNLVSDKAISTIKLIKL